MRSERIRSAVTLASVALVVTLGACDAAARGKSGRPKGKAAEAIAAYDAGDCETAVPLLRELDAKKKADGPLLYRLYYCQRQAGDTEARDTMVRAKDALMTAFDRKPTLEGGFYLANVHRNSAKISQAKEVAKRVTDLIEDGNLARPKQATQTFQLGKLYADQDRLDDALPLFETALTELVQPGQPAPPSAQWAARFLAERAWDAEEWKSAARYYGMIALDGASPDDRDRLAIALVHDGQLRPASKAWYESLRLNPATGDHARYCAQLATQAAEFDTLPETAPDGRPWAELSGEDLGQVLLEKAQFAAQTIQPYKDDPASLTRERRAELSAQLEEARAYFMTAGLQAAVRRLPLRETAFQSGYAPMVFHKKRWQLPRAPRGKGKGGKRKAKAS